MSRTCNDREIAMDHLHMKRKKLFRGQLLKSKIFQIFRQHSHCIIEILHAWRKVNEYCIDYYQTKGFL